MPAFPLTKRHGHTVAVVLLPVLVLIVCSGCLTSRTANRVTADLEQELPALRLDEEMSLTLGRMSLALARAVLHLGDADLDDDEMAFIEGVRRVEIGIFQVVESADSGGPPRLYRLGKNLARKGWSNIVRTSEEDEYTWVFSKTDAKGDLRGLVVVVLEDDELLVVRLDGELQEALARATMDDPQAVVEIFASD